MNDDNPLGPSTSSNSLDGLLVAGESAEKLPLWAKASSATVTDDEDSMQHEKLRVTISDLPLMVNEVSGLLDVMEPIMGIQRARRLEKLKPPSWFRQNWYISAVAVPTTGYVLYKVFRHEGWKVVKYTAEKFIDFFREHVTEPLFGMYVRR